MKQIFFISLLSFLLTIATEISKEEQVSVGRACKIIAMSRSMYYYKKQKDDSPVNRAIRNTCYETVPCVPSEFSMVLNEQ